MVAAGLAYQLSVDDGVLRIVIHRDFDTGSLHQDWSTTIIQQSVGTYVSVVVDLSKTGLLSSTFFAGLVRLYQYFVVGKGATLVLHHPDPRTIRNLAILKMSDLFTVVPRTA